MNQDLYCSSRQDHGLDKALDQQLIVMSREALDSGKPVRFSTTISNVNRTVGTMLGHELTKAYGGQGLPDGTIDITFEGSAGNSLGAFVPKGITLRIYGDANDYVGKGLSGGRIVVRPSDNVPQDYVAEENIIGGNVILFGATSGEVFLRGVVGERFAVRNSGAHAVVEGVGDHGCEYMTGGKVVILGGTGRNFAAGMSGGVAYVFDERGDFTEKRCNLESVDLEPLVEDPLFAAPDKSRDESREVEAKLVKDLVARHFALTASPRAAWILEHWADAQPRFIKIFPHEYKRVLGFPRTESVYGTAHVSSNSASPRVAAAEVQHG